MIAPLELRPYQILCLICAQGRKLEGAQAQHVEEALRQIREYPDRPVTLRACARDVYAYQDPAGDAEAASEFSRKRDLDVLAALDLPPGITLPARTLLYRIMKAIPTVSGLCGHDSESTESGGVASCATGPADFTVVQSAGPVAHDVTPPDSGSSACTSNGEDCGVAEAWAGCPRVEAGHYEAGLARGIEALIPPRDAEEMVREKRASVAAMDRGEPLRIRPHVMMCAVCNFGQKEGLPAPLAEDNIVEFIEIIRRRPETPVVMAPGADWMICAPCPRRVPELNACVNVAGSGGLSNEKRDLDLLQVLGLTYEMALPAREMLRLLFSRVPDTRVICKRNQPRLSVWWDGCGEANCTAGNTGYSAGREMLCDELKLDL